ncbi:MULTISPECIES: CopC domain-containing protein YobA [Enterobacteriaceae]|jgi:methionine-rich copper-binding protein CopC|uniref:Copper resistance protein C n=1 Tax=Citrobacter bitternis TaxID=1585982 RepID=A0ABW1Q2J0_9ENTR|nr:MULTISPECIES: CopC domain-containing protein YobA [Phytobacter]MBS6738667.1 CopC domain-containing protein YobA [Enterobacteriaceae bacterium]MBY6255888.1 CopC domain-containing protein YobA [Phytobacter diazotrophicus]MDV2901426.1 CopC domain-containing protein YobA [Phytobacter diazotrophicus]QJF18340.1 CopC domain-containing protein YobA [Phytobacter diazotrophicus]
MLFTASHLTRALVFAAALATTPAVFAHAHLKNQYPAANAEVTAAPQALTLNFSEGIEPKFSGVTLTGAQQQSIKTGAVKRNEQDKTQMIVPLAQALQPGNYTVDWHVVSVDGHKTHGTYTFSVK